MGSKQKIVYIISGPVGVGKSTASRRLANHLSKVVLIEGDHFLNMFRYTEALSFKEKVSRSWEEIVSITLKLLADDFDVIIDFVVEDELLWLVDQFNQMECEIKYVVLHANEKVILDRIRRRGDIEMMNRSLELLHQLTKDVENEPFLMNTDNKTSEDIVTKLLSNRYIYI